MKTKALFGFGVVMTLGVSWGGSALFAKNARPRPTAFEELKMHIEVDLPSPALAGFPLDFPAEVVLEASSEHRFAAIQVMDHAGRPVLALDCPSSRTLGISELALDCKDVTLRDALREYPPGNYLVQATTVDGASIEGTAKLERGFPGFFAVVSPLPQQVVRSENVTISWTPSRGASRYELEIEQDEIGFVYKVRLPPWQTSFELPARTLEPGTTYEFSLTVQGDTDNELEVEGSFVTARGNHVVPAK